MQAQARLRRCSMGGATGPKLRLAQRSMVRKEKSTLKRKLLRFRKSFQVAAGQSIKTLFAVMIISESIH